MSKEPVIVETLRFGKMEIQPDKVLHIQGGLLGFPGSQLFALLDHAEGSPFKWLQSLDEGELAVPVCDPKLFFPDYHIRIKRDELASLRVKRAEELVILVILSLQNEPKEMTANLLGPVIIHAERLIGRQIVLKDAPYSTKHYLFPELRK